MSIEAVEIPFEVQSRGFGGLIVAQKDSDSVTVALTPVEWLDGPFDAEIPATPGLLFDFVFVEAVLRIDDGAYIDEDIDPRHPLSEQRDSDWLDSIYRLRRPSHDAPPKRHWIVESQSAYVWVAAQFEPDCGEWYTEQPRLRPYPDPPPIESFRRTPPTEGGPPGP